MDYAYVKKDTMIIYKILHANNVQTFGNFLKKIIT